MLTPLVAKQMLLEALLVYKEKYISVIKLQELLSKNIYSIMSLVLYTQNTKYKIYKSKVLCLIRTNLMTNI